jgi:hypothetical protein
MLEVNLALPTSYIQRCHGGGSGIALQVQAWSKRQQEVAFMRVSEVPLWHLVLLGQSFRWVLDQVSPPVLLEEVVFKKRKIPRMQLLFEFS